MKPSRNAGAGDRGAADAGPSAPARSGAEGAGAEGARALVRRHLVFGWGALLVFLSLGIVLEALHGLKVGLYVNPSGSARRLMWTLAHAHGTLLGLIHLAFAATIFIGGAGDWRRAGWVSLCLRSATYLLPGGFFLGGLVTYGGDPGLGVFLVPVGALALVGGVGWLWLGLRKG